MRKRDKNLKKRLMAAGFLVSIVLFLTGCDMLLEEEAAAGFSEPGADSLAEFSNPNATVVEDASDAETLLVGMVEEIYNYLQYADPVGSVRSVIPASETDSASDSDSWGPETYEGPSGGTFDDSGSTSESYSVTYPDETDTLPAPLSIQAQMSFSENGTFEDYEWYSYTGGGYYVLNGAQVISVTGSLSGSGTIRDANAYGEPTDASGTITATLSANMSFAYTAEPADNHTGDAVRVVAFINTSDSTSVTFDESDTSTNIDYALATLGDQAMTQVDITGTIKVYDEAGELIDEKQLESSTVESFIDLTDLVD